MQWSEGGWEAELWISANLCNLLCDISSPSDSLEANAHRNVLHSFFSVSRSCSFRSHRSLVLFTGPLYAHFKKQLFVLFLSSTFWFTIVMYSGDEKKWRIKKNWSMRVRLKVGTRWKTTKIVITIIKNTTTISLAEIPTTSHPQST